MSEVRLANLVIDCADVGLLARFWRDVTGFQPRTGLPPLDDPRWTEDEEATAAHIQSIGATFLWRSADPEDPFVTLADPEGNEFCIVRAMPATAGDTP